MILPLLSLLGASLRLSRRAMRLKIGAEEGWYLIDGRLRYWSGPGGQWVDLEPPTKYVVQRPGSTDAGWAVPSALKLGGRPAYVRWVLAVAVSVALVVTGWAANGLVLVDRYRDIGSAPVPYTPEEFELADKWVWEVRSQKEFDAVCRLYYMVGYEAAKGVLLSRPDDAPNYAIQAATDVYVIGCPAEELIGSVRK